MMYFLNAEGTLARCLPERVYQGGSEGNRVMLAAPFAESAAVSASFLLPDGTTEGPFLLTYAGKIGEVGIAGQEAYGWALALPACVTARCGTVRVQFAFQNAAGEQTVSAAAEFTVERGVPQPLPPAPPEDAYTALSAALSAVSADLDDGLYAARAVYAWNASHTYGANELAYCAVEGGRGRFVRSLANGNDAAPYPDGQLDAAHWAEVLDFDALSAAAEEASEAAAQSAAAAESAKTAAQQAAQTAQQSAAAAAASEEAVTAVEGNFVAKAQWEALLGGTVAAGAAECDGEGNEIAQTYLKKSELLGLVYPVGAIYLSLAETSPSVLFGGTWEAIEDRFLYAAGTYSAGATGGEEKHKLLSSEIPDHTHTLYGKPAETGGTPASGMLAVNAEGEAFAWSNHMLQAHELSHVGASSPHNNMPPYYVVHMWRRTA